jgi:nucleotidyltransferase substrate binding protein (TIGR01987 family)
MNNADIQWQQRFSSYQRSLAQLTKFIEHKPFNELEELGLIQSFKCTHDLAWKLLKDFLNDRGNHDIYDSRETTRAAFNLGLIDKGEVWMEMIQDRDRTSHTYNQEIAKEIATHITEHFFERFIALKTKMQAIENAQQDNWPDQKKYLY